MTAELLSKLLLAAGFAHFGILIASSLVPFRLNWRKELAGLSRLHRQMYWTYGGYVVLSIIAFGCITVANHRELAARSPLARGFCLYVFVFWLIRIGLQAVFDVKPHLTAWWLKAGYHGLSVVFTLITIVFGWAAFGTVR